MQKTHSYSVILMDMLMPEMDGIDATKAIRSDRNLSQPVIIAMTANALPEDKEICLQAGMNDFITKPFKLEVLTELLQKIALQLKG